MFNLPTKNIDDYTVTRIQKELVFWLNQIGMVKSHEGIKEGTSYIFDKNRATGFYNNYTNKGSAENFNIDGIMPLVKLNKLLTALFRDNNYKICEPINILHKNREKEALIEDTLFTIAGVQILDDELFGTKVPTANTEKFFVAQPSIRMSSLNRVGLKMGYFSSFINVSSEIINPAPKDYVNDIELWLKFLTTYMDPGKITLRVQNREVAWSGRSSMVFQIYYYYKDLEIGDSTFHYAFNRSDGAKVTFLDSGFGLERLALGIYEGETNLEVISPAYFHDKKFGFIDRIRNLTLLIGSNVLPDGTAAGLKVRHLAKDLAECEEDYYLMYELVPYFYTFWSDFTASTLIISPAKIKGILKEEYYRQKNKLLANKLGLNLSNQEFDIPPYEFVENCIVGKYGKTFSREKLYSIIKNAESPMRSDPYGIK